MNSPQSGPRSDESKRPRGWKTLAVGLLAGALAAAVVMTTVMLLLRTFFGVPTIAASPMISDRALIMQVNAV